MFLVTSLSEDFEDLGGFGAFGICSCCYTNSAFGPSLFQGSPGTKGPRGDRGEHGNPVSRFWYYVDNDTNCYQYFYCNNSEHILQNLSSVNEVC